MLILLALSGLFVIILLKTRQPFGKNNSSFASEPKEEITKIDLSENGKRLILEKKGDTWMINGKFEARKSGIFFIIRILKEIRIKSPVSSQLFDSVIIAKNIIPVRVKVYENRRLLKTFLVYKTGSNNYGNIMKMREGSKPFIVYVPGFEGDIGSGFTLNELFWQPYTVFDLLPSEIASIKFENLTDTASSFSIINTGHHYSLTGSGGWDSSLVFRYISYFARVPFESWAFDLEETRKRSIEAQQPLYRISVTSEAGRKSTLTLWEMYRNTGDSTKVDSDRLYGKTDDRDDLFIMRYFDIDPLIKKRTYFFLK
jgi:hypothetical protein